MKNRKVNGNNRHRSSARWIWLCAALFSVAALVGGIIALALGPNRATNRSAAAQIAHGADPSAPAISRSDSTTRLAAPARFSSAQPPSSAASNDALPTLRGEEAIQRLKQQGLYDSLQAAMAATWYQVNWQEKTELPNIGGAYQAANPAQGMSAYFTETTLHLAPRQMDSHASGPQAWRTAMTLTGYGYGERLTAVGPGQVTANGNRVEIHHQSAIRNPQSAIVEWYINQAEGLEQGFSVPAPPPAAANGERLQLRLALSGDLRAEIAEEGRAIMLSNAAGERVLRYGGLSAYDATGRELAARMQLQEREVRLEVDDREAVYPLVIDPTFTQQAHIVAGDAASGDRFGYAVAISGETAIVGAYADDVSFSDQGSAYIFVRSGTTWTQQQKLVASDGMDSDNFGIAVAISGETAIVGAYLDDEGANTDQGSAYIFVRNSGTWTEQRKLVASDGAKGDNFGTAVAISGETVVIGAAYDDLGANSENTDQGSAYVFVRNGTTWTEQQKLVATDGAAGDIFGFSVAISGETAVVGAYADNEGANSANTDQGSAYVFVRNGTTWTEQRKLVASDGAAGDFFGIAVAISGETIVVGAYLHDVSLSNNSLSNNQGSAYVYVRSGTTWTEQQKLVASDGAASDFFGVSVAISGEIIVVGADYDDISANDQGSAYIFVRSGTTWTQQQKLVANDGGSGDLFGISVAISGETIIVGAHEDDVTFANQGSAYIFSSTITVDGTLTEPGYTTLGTQNVASCLGPGHEINSLNVANQSGNIYLGIGGNVQAGNRILVFIDSKSGGYNDGNFGRAGAPQGIDDFNPGTTFDANFFPDYALVIGTDGGGNYSFDLYTLSGTASPPSGGGPNTFIGSATVGSPGGANGAAVGANPANGDPNRGFEARIPYSLLGLSGATTSKFFAAYISDSGSLANQFISPAGTTGCYGSGQVDFAAQPPDPVSFSFAPTAVELISFTATANKQGQVLLQWQTGYEVDNLGFHLYREVGGERARVNPSLIAGSALLAGPRTPLTAGYSYAWTDQLSKDSGYVQYWLEDVDLNGTRTLHGPITPAPGELTQQERAKLLSQLQPAASALAAGPPAQQGWPASSTSRLSQMSLRQPAKQQSLTTQQWLAGQAAVKLQVRRAGWYRVTRAELLAAGLDPAVDANRLQLYAEGQQVPLRVSGSQKRARSFDAIEFYGLGLDTPASDTQTYWLVAGAEPGQRIAVQDARGLMAAQPQSYAYTIERKERTVYFAALQNGEAENFFGPVITTEPVGQTLTVSHLDATATWPATLEVALQGATAGAHRVRAQLNGQDLGTIELADREHKTARFSVAQSSLLVGENTLTLMAINGEGDVSVVDWVRLTYTHRYRADDDVLRFSLSARQSARIDGFSTAQIRVVDITNLSAIQELRVQAEATENGYAVSIPASPGRMPVSRGSRTLLAFAENKVEHPAAILANEPSSWHSTEEGADLVVITHAAFRKSAEELAEARRSQGLQVAVVDVADIYDEFSYGAHSSQAVKDFLAWTKNHWRLAPRYALLLGDSSFDPRNYLGQGQHDYVPTKLVDTAYLETASDDTLADFDGDGLPELAMGRLPVRTAAEAATVVSKIINYVPGNAGQEALLIADRTDGFNFAAANRQVRALLPETLAVEMIERGEQATETVRNQILTSLNRGQLLVNYIGHGSVERWAGAGLLTSADASTLTNGQRVPLMVLMTCLNGFAQDVYTESLAEALLKAEQGGAVAVWASSGLTEPEQQALINQELYRQLFGAQQNVTVGEAVRAAKAATADADVRRTWMLFGDPAQRLR